MRATRITRWAAFAAIVAAPALHAQGAPPAQTAAAPSAAPAQPPSACDSTPNCVETNDFAAVITNFRTSDSRGYKIIDVVMHFQNKTPKSLVLAYLQNSGTIIDDKGNRYVVYGANGVRGIGQVYGNSFDPKFTLGPSGNGDAQFELAWYPGQQIYGFTFSFDLTIDEINSYQGNQHSLGGEFPLHFQGLANGVSTGGPVTLVSGGVGAAGGVGGGVAAAGAAGGQPCSGAAGTATNVANATGSQAVQGAAAQGASAVATAASAVQSVASIFSKKKNTPAKPAASPCGSAGTAAQSAAPASTGAATASAPKRTAAAGSATTAAKTMSLPTTKTTTTTPPKT
ncbi:MAG: hypothetical protein ACREND_08700, partial [Gemmatimonadaceae bacterium]